MTHGHVIRVERRILASSAPRTARPTHAEAARSATRQKSATKIWIGVTVAAALLLLILGLVGVAGFPSVVVIAAFVIAVGWAAITVLLAPPPQKSRPPQPSRFSTLVAGIDRTSNRG